MKQKSMKQPTQLEMTYQQRWKYFHGMFRRKWIHDKLPASLLKLSWQYGLSFYGRGYRNRISFGS